MKKLKKSKAAGELDENGRGVVPVRLEEKLTWIGVLGLNYLLGYKGIFVGVGMHFFVIYIYIYIYTLQSTSSSDIVIGQTTLCALLKEIYYIQDRWRPILHQWVEMKSLIITLFFIGQASKALGLQRHWEYQSLEYLQVLPEAHVVQPVHPTPPHWPYRDAVQVEVAEAALLLVELVLVVDALEVVDTLDVERVELRAVEVVLDATDDDELELLPPVDPEIKRN